MVKADQIVCKYIHLNIQGIEYLFFYEEAGTGIPIIAQHSGGGDGLECISCSITRKLHQDTV